MKLEDQLRALAESPTARVVSLPFRPATESYPVAWLDLDADDVWESYPELDDVTDELGAYLPLADVAIRDDEHQCLVVARAAPHAVFVFDDGFHQLAPSLDAFVAGLREAGQPPAPPPPPPPSPTEVAAARRAALDAAIAARDWAQARDRAVAAIEGFKTPEALTELRAVHARVIAELADEVAGRELARVHVEWLQWLAKREHAQAVALQARFVELIDAMTIEAAGGAAVLAAIRAGISAPLAAPTPPEVTPANINMAVRLINAAKAPGLRSLLERVPQVLEVPEVQAALAALPDTPKANEVRQLVDLLLIDER